MAETDRNRSHGMQAAWALLAALTFAMPVARAQQSPARPPQPVYRTYQQPMARPVTRPPIQPMVARPMPTRPTMMYRQSMPARRPRWQMIRPLPTTSVRTLTAPEPFASRPFAPYGLARPLLPPPNFRAAFRPRSAWIGARGYFNSFLFGGWPLNAYGYWQVPPTEQMLPLGFGMWPACDSANIPGRFWSAGPCFGVGDYQSLQTGNQNESLTPSAQYYPPALEFIVQPEAAATSSSIKPSQPEKKPNMVVCLTNGNEMEVSDWWVTEGRFYFVPITNGKTQTVDLNTLDLQKTIEENEKRGRTFILNFTPPNERPTSLAPASNR
jgi:hypothetical protein